MTSTNSTDSIYGDMQVGFEYETLIKAIGDNEINFLKFADQFLSKYKIEEDTKNIIPANRDILVQRLLRYMIAYEANDFAMQKENKKDTQQMNVATNELNAMKLSSQDQASTKARVEKTTIPNMLYLTAIEDYGDKTSQIIKYTKAEASKPSWDLTHDGSVTVLQSSKRKERINMYTTLNAANINTFDMDKHDDFKKNKAVIECMEFVSPPLPIKEYDTQIKTFLEHIKLAGLETGHKLEYYNNSKTSNHIHMSCGNLLREPENLLKVCMAWWYFEPLFMHMVPFWRRDNKYCHPMNTLVKLNYEGDAYKLFVKVPKQLETKLISPTITKKSDKVKYDCIDLIMAMFQGDPDDRSSRYAAFNMANLRKGGIGTLEIRLKHGSNDPDEINKYIELFTKFVASAIENPIINNDINLKVMGKRNNAWLVKDCGTKAWPFEDDVTKEILDALLGELFEFINKKNTITTREYFQKILDLHRDKKTYYDYYDTSSSQSSDQMEGGKKPEKKVLVFCYGSNGTKQLKERTGATDMNPTPAYLDNHTRIFAGYSGRWDGGIASVHPEIGSRVYGMVVEITKAEMEILDSYEGGYTRKQRIVVLQKHNGPERMRSKIYIKDNHKFTHMPSIAYLKAIRKMLDECNRTDKKNIAIKGIENKKAEILGFFKAGKIFKPKVKDAPKSKK
jgi:hypothetical protein